ncbi:AMP-binding protein [archaeon]|jgi:long-chain acyl-CoA synthetase|nr:AMP-binding protein [archaeon]MBT4022347.1 AMP-binding protein [archaeon]MBT4273225.1 AMP-binding protein [archaeon]MBT4461332.1 AMP-binding protein [archaeon]MBT4858989.1 AMP-binding protein [archaeon]
MSQLSRSLKNTLIKFKNKRLVSLKKDFVYQRYTYQDIHNYSLKLITFFKENNIKKGDKVAICVYNSPQYFYTYIACMFSGVILVPMDFSSSNELMKKFIDKTKTKLLITSVKKIVNFKIKKVYVEELDEILEPKPKGKIQLTKEDDLAQIMFTSGTTGEPKGVMISHGNIYSNIIPALKFITIKPSDRAISIIPLSHIFEQTIFLGMTLMGASTTHLRSRRSSEIRAALNKEKPTIIAAVPAFFNLFKRRIEEKAKEKGKYETLQKTLKLASSLPRIARKIIFKDIHKVFGGKLNLIICGGAALSVQTEEFFENIGMNVINGYGLTETSPLLTANKINDKKIGSAGKVIGGVELKLSKQKEVLARGKNITPGYYKNPSATKKLIQNNWLHTGDIGEFDEDGFLFIRGRVKNMILKQNGMNVYPEDIEKILDKEQLIKESCVIGLNKGTDVIITAALLLSKKASNKEIQKVIDKTNKKLEFHQKIQEFIVWKKKDFPRSFSFKVKKVDVQKTIESKTHTHTQSKDEIIHILSLISHIDASIIKENSNLYSDLGFDSLKTIELSSMIEELLRIEIDEYLIDSKTTVKDLKELVVRGKQEEKERKVSKRMFSKFFIPLRAVFPEFAYLFGSMYFSSIKVIGKKYLNEINEPVVIIFNHTSHLDAQVIGKHLPAKIRSKSANGAAADYFFKDSKKIKDWLKTRFFRYFLGAFPVARVGKETKSTLKQTFEYIGEAVDHRWNISLSPEGTRTRSGKMNPFKSGIGIIVKETGYPVLPIKLKGLYDIMPPGASWPVKKGPAEIEFGKLIRFKSLDTPVEITQKLEKVIRNM